MEPFRSKFSVLPWIVREESTVRLPSDVSHVPSLATFLSEHAVVIGRCAPKRESHLATALTEALTNAVVHGNLEVSSDHRDENCEEGYHSLVKQRQQESPYCNRIVEVVTSVQNGKISWTISDEGRGFDVNELPDPTDPENLFRCSGRGVLLMNAFSDELEYNDTGNQVTLTIYAPHHS